MSDRKIPFKEIYHTVISTVLIAALTWAWNLQGRITALESTQKVVKRVENLENLMIPIAIEFEVNKRMEEREAEMAALYERSYSVYDGASAYEEPIWEMPEYLLDDSSMGVPPPMEILEEPVAPLISGEMLISPEDELDIDAIEDEIRQQVLQYRPDSK